MTALKPVLLCLAAVLVFAAVKVVQARLAAPPVAVEVVAR